MDGRTDGAIGRLDEWAGVGLITAGYQGLSIQRDRKHCINFADNKNYLVGTVPYSHWSLLKHLWLLCNELVMAIFRTGAGVKGKKINTC